MDPLGSLQVCVYYVKQMNAFPILTTEIMSALTGAGIINGDCVQQCKPTECSELGSAL